MMAHTNNPHNVELPKLHVTLCNHECRSCVKFNRIRSRGCFDHADQYRCPANCGNEEKSPCEAFEGKELLFALDQQKVLDSIYDDQDNLWIVYESGSENGFPTLFAGIYNQFYVKIPAALPSGPGLSVQDDGSVQYYGVELLNVLNLQKESKKVVFDHCSRCVQENCGKCLNFNLRQAGSGINRDNCSSHKPANCSYCQERTEEMGITAKYSQYGKDPCLNYQCGSLEELEQFHQKIKEIETDKLNEFNDMHQGAPF